MDREAIGREEEPAVADASTPLIQAGDRIVIPADDYAGGRGWLRMRVTRVQAPADRDVRQMSWVQLTGVELIGPDDGRELTAVVRVAALVGAHPPMRPGSQA